MTKTKINKKNIKRVEKQLTQRGKSSDNFFNAKVQLLNIEDGDHLMAVLNPVQARGFGINAKDIISVMKSTGETIVLHVALSNEIETGVIGIYNDVLERFPVEAGDSLSVMLTQSSATSLEAIKKKMRGETITYEEMFAIIKDISEGKLDEILMTYYVASSFFYPTTDEEMYQTAKAMAECGVTFRYPKGQIVADKHCIGGVPGNETTMIIIPIIASLGIKIPKNFSKSITSPAATGECVNVIMGINFDQKGIEKLIDELNCCLVWGGGLDLAPADDKIIRVQYPLSMQSRAKVVSSIMAKKYAMGITHSLIDIPVGPTAKVATMKEAKDWKKKFEFVGEKLGMKMSVQITEAKEVIGNGVGACLQVREVLRVLQQHEKRPSDLEKKAIYLASKIIELVGMAKGEEALEIAKGQLRNGQAWEMMQRIIKAQNGKDPAIQSEKVPLGTHTYDVVATQPGTVKEINLHNINQIARRLGCPVIDEAGLYLHKKTGDKVAKGDVIYTMYALDDTKIKLALELEQERSGYVIS